MVLKFHHLRKSQFLIGLKCNYIFNRCGKLPPQPHFFFFFSNGYILLHTNFLVYVMDDSYQKFIIQLLSFLNIR